MNNISWLYMRCIHVGNIYTYIEYHFFIYIFLFKKYHNHKDISVSTSCRLFPLAQYELNSAFSESGITIPRKLSCFITHNALSPLVQAELTFGLLTSGY